MYKMCDRCRFNVPAKQSACHVCGNKAFVMEQVKVQKPLEIAAGLENCKTEMVTATSKVAGLFLGLGRELSETAAKAQRAADNMRRLIFEAGPDHDEVLSLHRSIGAGRSVHFSPAIPRTEAVQRQEFKSFRGKLLSDERMFAPKVDHNDLPLSQIGKPLEAVVIAEIYEELKLVPAASEPDVEMLRKNIDELKGWFESYGKEGLLVKKDLTAVPDLAEEKVTAEADHEESRQAA